MEDTVVIRITPKQALIERSEELELTVLQVLQMCEHAVRNPDHICLGEFKRARDLVEKAADRLRQFREAI